MPYDAMPNVSFGFVSGTFERLGTNEIEFLQSVRRRCDRLMVGVNVLPDATYQARRRALERLDCVDRLCMYEDVNDLATTIAELNPSPCYIEHRWADEFQMPEDCTANVEFYGEERVAA